MIQMESIAKKITNGRDSRFREMDEIISLLRELSVREGDEVALKFSKWLYGYVKTCEPSDVRLICICRSLVDLFKIGYEPVKVIEYIIRQGFFHSDNDFALVSRELHLTASMAINNGLEYVKYPENVFAESSRIASITKYLPIYDDEADMFSNAFKEANDKYAASNDKFIIRAPRNMEEVAYQDSKTHSRVMGYYYSVASCNVAILFVADKNSNEPVATIVVYDNKIKILGDIPEGAEDLVKGMKV